MTSGLEASDLIATPSSSSGGGVTPAVPALLVASQLLPPVNDDLVETTAEHPGVDAGSTERAAAARIAASFLLGLAPATRTAYTGDLRDFATWCDGAGVAMLAARRVDIDAYLETLRLSGAAPATLNRRLAALSGYFAYAVDDDVIARSPTLRVRRPRVGQESTSTGLDAQELDALVAAAERDGARSHLVVLLLSLNGLRVSEACAARVEHLGTERGHRILTVTRKGGVTAKVPLAPITSRAVDAVLTRPSGQTKSIDDVPPGPPSRTEGPLLLTRNGTAMDRHAVWRLLRRLARTATPAKAGSLHPHDLRHAFVTLALDAGVSLRDVQDAAGHADPRTTRLYDRARHRLDRHPTYVLAGQLGISDMDVEGAPTSRNH